MPNVQPVKGMNVILPEQLPLWQTIEAQARQVLENYGYHEIRLPLVEHTELFKRSVGESSDIVTKEMYTFDDKKGRSLTLRPEGTAGCVRGGQEHHLFGRQVQRLWYMGPMFRYERPQKGRSRQFHQIGVETFGMAEADIEAELVLLASRFFRQLGVDQQLRLKINTIGQDQDRTKFKSALVEFLEDKKDDLDDDSRQRLATNPLRILDSKIESTQAILKDAPKLPDYLSQESSDHFQSFIHYLDNAEIAYEVDPLLVRGLDYYNHTVFEWVTAAIGAQDAVCAGGRYDNLVSLLGGKPTPAAGFAIGQERLVLLLSESGLGIADAELDVYIAASPSQQTQALALAETLRDRFPTSSIQLQCAGASLNKARKKAEKLQASYLVLLPDTTTSKTQSGPYRLQSVKDKQADIWLDQAQLLANLSKSLKIQ